ncbi:MAG: hypothetical protein MJ072_00040 [Clostridia bacterium]|nr:hypothetical protein [Clostridia bacterium]
MYCIIDKYGELVESGFATEKEAWERLKKLCRYSMKAVTYKVAFYYGK